MSHAKQAMQRHNGPVGWLIILGLLWIMANGLMNKHTPEYEADRVEQTK